MKISIPEPCSEDWSKMSPTEQGAFCQKCALEVTDFTNKSAWEIKTILTHKIEAKQRVCGRIENHQLAQLNHDFIHWKSDQESFRAIWMFSLVAVFGLTLFSCQSTFSKEMVEKMNTSSLELIDEKVEEVEPVLDSTANDSARNDSLVAAVNPWGNEIISSGGTVMLGGFGLDWKVITSINPYIVEMTLGMFGSPSTEEDIITDSVSFAGFYSPLNAIALPPTQSPRAHERPVNPSQRLDAKLEKGKPDFDAYISPNPVNETSKLFVTIPNEGTLELVVVQSTTKRELHREEMELQLGNYEVSINFQDFPVGEYEALLKWEENIWCVPFEVSDCTIMS